MTRNTYKISQVETATIQDDIELLIGHSHLWRVECNGRLAAYCVDKALADRIANENLYRTTISPTGTLFSYPSPETAVAVCVGTVNTLLRDTD